MSRSAGPRWTSCGRTKSGADGAGNDPRHDLRGRSAFAPAHPAGFEQLAGRSFAGDQEALDEWATSIHPEDREWVLRAIRANRVDGANFEQTYRIIHSDGRTIHVWHRGTYQRDLNGQLVRAFGVVEDVTAEHELRADLRLTERALRESQQILSAVAESSWVHLTMFDSERVASSPTVR